MSAGLCEPEASPGYKFFSFMCPGSLIAGANDYDCIRIFFDPRTSYCATTGVSTAIRSRRKPVLPRLPQIHIPARCGKVSLLEMPERVRSGVVAAHRQAVWFRVHRARRLTL